MEPIIDTCLDCAGNERKFRISSHVDGPRIKMIAEEIIADGSMEGYRFETYGLADATLTRSTAWYTLSRRNWYSFKPALPGGCITKMVFACSVRFNELFIFGFCFLHRQSRGFSLNQGVDEHMTDFTKEGR